MFGTAGTTRAGSQFLFVLAMYRVALRSHYVVEARMPSCVSRCITPYAICLDACAKGIQLCPPRIDSTGL